MDDALASIMAISVVNREYDVASHLLEQQVGVPLCVQCGKCCEQNTPLAYGLEAANAVSRLIGRGRLYQFQRRIEGWLLERHSQCTIYEQARLNVASEGISAKLRDEVLALSRTQCPFYENRSCLVHEFRPLCCRAYGVTLSVENCSRKSGKGETLTQRLIVSKEIRSELRAEVDEALSRVPRDTWKHAGFFPTLIFAHAWPETFARYTANGLIAQAKLTMTYPSMAVLFEEDMKRISLTPRDLFREDQRELARR